ncbi:MAG TPA: LPS export ABC transporter periplasmic protein LptC [Chryseosolibacter sp.]
MKRILSLSLRALALAFSVSFVACKDSDLKEPVEYTGPLRKIQGVETFYTEKNMVKVKMVAADVYEYENGDREFPNGLYIEFFNEFGKLESTLKANRAYFFKKENQWRGRGKVEVKNIAKNEQLNTEELFWKPAEEKIFTEKFVTIRQEGDVIYGRGLEAKQDMSEYEIMEPTGDFEVKEE